MDCHNLVFRLFAVTVFQMVGLLSQTFSMPSFREFTLQFVNRRWVAASTCFLGASLAWGQAISSGSQSLLQTVMQEQQSLAQEATSVFGQGTTTSASVTDWQRNMPPRFKSFNRMSSFLGAQSEMQPIPYITDKRPRRCFPRYG
jgi:hypothetical protein